MGTLLPLDLQVVTDRASFMRGDDLREIASDIQGVFGVDAVNGLGDAMARAVVEVG